MERRRCGLVLWRCPACAATSFRMEAEVGAPPLCFGRRRLITFPSVASTVPEFMAKKSVVPKKKRGPAPTGQGVQVGERGSRPFQQRQPREPEKPPSRYADQSSSLSAWVAPLDSGALTAPNSMALTCRREEPSTASFPDNRREFGRRLLDHLVGNGDQPHIDARFPSFVT